VQWIHLAAYENKGRSCVNTITSIKIQLNWEIPSTAEELSVSEEGLCFMESFNLQSRYKPEYSAFSSLVSPFF
jgi:hypothetical protein